MGLPIISRKEAAKAFKKIAYKAIRQNGSHLRLRDNDNQFHKPITIPNHKVIKPGLLRKLIKDANLSVEEFLSINDS